MVVPVAFEKLAAACFQCIDDTALPVAAIKVVVARQSRRQWRIAGLIQIERERERREMLPRKQPAK